jgi:hypothetical protein
MGILQQWRELTRFCGDSIVVDVGSGLCRFLMHAVGDGVQAAYGIEVDVLKCQKAESSINVTLQKMRKAHSAAAVAAFLPEGKVPHIIFSSIHDIRSIDPATHVLACWQGFSQVDQKATGKLFCESSTVLAVTIVQHFQWVDVHSSSPLHQQMEAAMAGLGFGQVRMVGLPLPVKMSGGRNEQLQAYTFLKLSGASPSTRGQGGLPGLPSLARFCSSDSRAILKRGKAVNELAKLGKKTG